MTDAAFASRATACARATSWTSCGGSKRQLSVSFVAKGFDDTTMREIAVRAGVGLGTIFLYAKDKRDLLFLTINEPLEQITQEAENVFDPKAPLMDNL